MTFVKKRWKWIAGIIAVLALLVLAQKVPVFEWLDKLAEPVRKMGWVGVALYALLYFLAGMCCVPCSPLTLAAGYILGTVRGVIAIHTGCVLAAACGFLVGRFLGRRHAAEWFRKRPRFHQIDDAIAQEGWKIVGLLRLQAIPFGLSNYLYGMTKIDVWHYILATFVAMLPGHIIYVYLSEVGGRHLADKAPIGPLELIAPALAIVSMSFVTVMLTRMVKRHKAAHKVAEAAEG
jgi:uncharacterized membrane protein YdjX (TVP38/TMEM64 family)